jgi:hypothetical protein
MTVLRSASGTRIDCDSCDDYVAASALAIETLRRATGYLSHDDRDYCPACWAHHKASRGDAERRGRDSNPRSA